MSEQEGDRLHLYEIVDEIQELGDALAENEGELTPELEARWDKIAGDLESKVENTALYIRDLELTAEAVKKEEDRHKARRRAIQNKADGLKDYLHFQLDRLGEERVETDRVRVRVQKNPRPSITWTGEDDAIPEAFKRVKVSPDLSAAWKELKAGTNLPDGFQVSWGRHIRIE